MYKTIFIAAVFLVACSSPTNNATSTVTPSDTVKPIASNTTMPRVINYKDSILGNWTDGSSEDATIMVQADSILYISHLDKYKYTVKNDSIKIYFKDTISICQMRFKADTVLWIDKTDTTKLWRFN